MGQSIAHPAPATGDTTSPPGADPSPPAATSATEAEVKRPRTDLEFEIEKSIRYHNRRRAHYELLDRSNDVVTILLGAGVIVAAFNATAAALQFEQAIVTAAFGLAAMLCSTLTMVFRPALRARDHFDLMERFRDMADHVEAVIAAGEYRAKLPDLNKRVRAIETREPAVFWIVEADCFNEVTRAWGLAEAKGLVPLTRWQRFTMNWLRAESVELPPAVLPPPKAAANSASPAVAAG